MHDTSLLFREKRLLDVCPTCEKNAVCHYCGVCRVDKPVSSCVWHNCEHVKEISGRILPISDISVQATFKRLGYVSGQDREHDALVRLKNIENNVKFGEALMKRIGGLND